MTTMNDLVDRQTEEFWDRLVRNPDRPPVARTEAEELIVTALALFPSTEPDGSADRARARLFGDGAVAGAVSATRRPARSAQPWPSKQRGELETGARVGPRWKWASLAAALLLLLSASGLWLASTHGPLANRSGSDHPAVIPAVSPNVGAVAMRGVDPGRTNAVAGPSLDAAPALAWSYEVGGVIRTTPIVTDGIAYAGESGLSPQNPGAVLAINASDGSLLWSAATTYGLSTTPLVDGGTIYAVDDGGNLYALDTGSGTLRWQVSLSESDGYQYSWYGAPSMIDGKLVLSSGFAMPVAASDDTIFVGQPGDEWLQGDRHVYAISPIDGSIVWDISGFPAGSSGLFALSVDDGSLLWSLSEGSALLGPSYADGLVYFGTDDPGTILAVDADNGAVVWRAAIGASQQWDGVSSPAISDDAVIVTTRLGEAISLDRQTGEERWRVQIFSSDPVSYVPPPTSVFIAESQGILLGHDTVVAIDLADGSVTWKLNGPTGDTTGAVLVDRMLYQVIRSETDDKGRLLAFAANGRST